jgi:hypothetical protein
MSANFQELATGCLFWVRTVLKGQYRRCRPEKLPKRAPKVGIFVLRARFKQLFGPALRVTVATIHDSIVVREFSTCRTTPVPYRQLPEGLTGWYGLPYQAVTV